jgi:hypothetical protein
MTEILITNLSGTPTGEYTVEIHEGGEVSWHVVDVPAEYVSKLGYDSNDEETVSALLRDSFQFLLKRESKEAILKNFTLSDIERYFTDYRDELAG